MEMLGPTWKSLLPANYEKKALLGEVEDLTSLLEDEAQSKAGVERKILQHQQQHSLVSSSELRRYGKKLEDAVRLQEHAKEIEDRLSRSSLSSPAKMTPIGRPRRWGASPNSHVRSFVGTHEIDNPATHGGGGYPTSGECAGATIGGGRGRSGGSSAGFVGDSGGRGGTCSRTREKLAGAVRMSRTEQIFEDEEKYLN